MERIVIEVDDTTAKKWRLISQRRKEEISGRINVALAKELAESKEDLLQFLDELRATMESRGLTEEALQEILKDDD